MAIQAQTTRLDRITFDPEMCGGRACIRGMRVRVIDVLELLANGLAPRDILEQLPYLEEEDVYASLEYAAKYLDHPKLVAQA
jgi:uncharacterized protein (DUF433 family)